jgi:hypothetical protein
LTDARKEQYGSGVTALGIEDLEVLLSDLDLVGAGVHGDLGDCAESIALRHRVAGAHRAGHVACDRRDERVGEANEAPRSFVHKIPHQCGYTGKSLVKDEALSEWQSSAIIRIEPWWFLFFGRACSINRGDPASCKKLSRATPARARRCASSLWPPTASSSGTATARTANLARPRVRPRIEKPVFLHPPWLYSTLEKKEGTKVPESRMKVAPRNSGVC